MLLVHETRDAILKHLTVRDLIVLFQVDTHHRNYLEECQLPFINSNSGFVGRLKNMLTCAYEELDRIGCSVDSVSLNLCCNRNHRAYLQRSKWKDPQSTELDYLIASLTGGMTIREVLLTCVEFGIGGDIYHLFFELFYADDRNRRRDLEWLRSFALHCLNMRDTYLFVFTLSYIGALDMMECGDTPPRIYIHTIANRSPELYAMTNKLLVKMSRRNVTRAMMTIVSQTNMPLPRY